MVVACMWRVRSMLTNLLVLLCLLRLMCLPEGPHRCIAFVRVRATCRYPIRSVDIDFSDRQFSYPHPY